MHEKFAYIQAEAIIITDTHMLSAAHLKEISDSGAWDQNNTSSTVLTLPDGDPSSSISCCRRSTD
jgi:hypothetical protein